MKPITITLGTLTLTLTSPFQTEDGKCHYLRDRGLGFSGTVYTGPDTAAFDENERDRRIDSFLDGDVDVYADEEGNLWAVELGATAPLFWSRVKKIACITSETLRRLIDEAMDDYADGQLDLYIHERGWQEWMNAFPEDQTQLIIDTLTAIYTYARGGCRAVREELGLTQIMFASVYGMSKRAVEEWEAGRREMPRYLLALILRTSRLLPVEVSSL